MTAETKRGEKPLSFVDRFRSSPYPFWDAPVFGTVAGLLLFWLLMVLFVLGRCRVGLYGTNYVSHDAFMVLDGAWRMLHHQRPHTDFNSMVGPFAYLPTLIGLRLAHNTAKGLAYGQALLGLLLAVWTFLLGRRLPDVPRAFYSACVLAYVISPAQLGISPFFLTPGMTYNRAAYGLLAVILLECCVTPRRMHFLGGLSTGLAMVALLFLKFTSILPTALLLVLLFPQKKQTRERWGGIACGTVLGMLVAGVYYHFHFGPVVSDILLTLGAKHIHISTLYSYDSIFLEAALGIVVSAAAAGILAAHGRRGEGRHLLLGGVVVAVVSVLVILSNWQQAELPLLTLYLIVVAARLPQTANSAGTSRLPRMATESGVLAFALMPLLSLCVALGAGMHSHDIKVNPVPKMMGDSLAPFMPVDGDTDYTDFVDNGYFLVKQNIRPGEHVMSLDFTNPFSFGLEIPPAPGGSTNLQYGGSFDDTHYVPAERLFGQAELVMLPIAYSDGTLTDTIPVMYGPYLHNHYHLVSELKRWQLYRRN